ncbi:MAG: hypothetical protein KAQ98_04115 [Bacteriovoracaceae bacterium]|nr:hypothetical protein [Bacteriovoracaceae bacterium]
MLQTILGISIMAIFAISANSLHKRMTCRAKFVEKSFVNITQLLHSTSKGSRRTLICKQLLVTGRKKRIFNSKIVFRKEKIKITLNGLLGNVKHKQQ